VPGDLPRGCFGGVDLATRRDWWRAVAIAVGSVVLLAGPLRAADDQLAGEAAIPAPALRALAEMRRLTSCPVAPTDDAFQQLVFRARPAIEIKGRERGGEATGTMRDLAVVDLATGRVVSFICFTNASTRKSGEAIISLAEVSSRSDKLARAILPGSSIELESLKRHRTGGTESIYYETRYMPAPGEFPFLEPPVRLLFNATTGGVFRLDIDPDWLDPADPPRLRISKKAAERIATVVLRSHDFAPAFGPGAVFGTVAAAEMFTVRPNDWLGFFRENTEVRARVAWVVPFRVNGAAAAGLHSLFVDAATGLILGGLSGQSAGEMPR